MSGPYRTPRVDIYTTMLIIALVAIVIATIFAYLETSDYGDKKLQGAPRVVHSAPVESTGDAPEIPRGFEARTHAGDAWRFG